LILLTPILRQRQTLINNIFYRNGFNIIQVACKSPKNGNYKLYGWSNNNISYEDKKKSEIYGFGISANQKINEAVAIFTRAGYKNHRVAENEGDLSFLLWNIGAQWSRVNDVIGFAAGQTYSTKSGIIKDYKYNSETQIELYYNFAVNDYITIAPVIQYFRYHQDQKSVNKETLVKGIRISITF